MNSDNNNNRHSNHHSSDPDIDDNQCSTPVPNITFPFLPGPPTHHSTHLLSPTTGSTMIADTGCTAHFVSPSTPVWHAKPADPPVHVRNPNGSVMTSTHQAELAIPGLPPQARTAHVLPDLKSGPLLSIGQLCDAGCDVRFDRGTVTVSHGHRTVLTGSRTADTKLWQIPLPEPPRHQANTTIGLPSIAEQVAFSHAALFSPALSTLETAHPRPRGSPHEIHRPSRGGSRRPYPLVPLSRQKDRRNHHLLRPLGRPWAASGKWCLYP